MNELKLKVTGTSDILMHDNKAANPLSKYAKALKKLTGTRPKTEEIYMSIARIEWEAGLYFHDNVVAIPARCIEKTFLMGARKSKKGKQYESGVILDEDWCPLNYSGEFINAEKSDKIPNPNLDKFFPLHLDQQMVKVGTSQVLRTRPIFHNWSFTCTLLHDLSIIDEDVLFKACEDAGRLVGLLEQRPRLGRFTIEKIS